MLQLLVDRPPTNDGEDGSEVVLENQTNIHVLKVKPEGVAKWGVYPIYYDWRRRRYYETYEEDNKIIIKYSNGTKFIKENPVNNIDTTKITATPKEAFYGKTDEDDSMPF